MSIRPNLAWFLRWFRLAFIVVCLVVIFAIAVSEQARSQEIDAAQERFWSWAVPATFAVLMIGTLVMTVMARNRRQRERDEAELAEMEYRLSSIIAEDTHRSLTPEEMRALRESFRKRFDQFGYVPTSSAASIHREHENRASAQMREAVALKRRREEEAKIQAQDDKRRKRMERSGEIERIPPPIILSKDPSP